MSQSANTSSKKTSEYIARCIVGNTAIGFIIANITASVIAASYFFSALTCGILGNGCNIGGDTPMYVDIQGKTTISFSLALFAMLTVSLVCVIIYIIQMQKRIAVKKLILNDNSISQSDFKRARLISVFGSIGAGILSFVASSVVLYTIISIMISIHVNL